MEKKWHYTKREKPDAKSVVIGFWTAEGKMFVSLCYRDEFGDWYVAQDMPGDYNQFIQPQYWIEQPSND